VGGPPPPARAGGLGSNILIFYFKSRVKSMNLNLGPPGRPVALKGSGPPRRPEV